MLAWHPRDVDVLREIDQAADDAAHEARREAERRRIWGGG